MAGRLAALILLVLPISVVAQDHSDSSLSSVEMDGTVGQYRVGLNYTVRNNTELAAAHYFYASRLANIALTGSVNGEAVEFKGEDGSVFHLHFVGNGSNGNDLLTFYNSIGLNGTWVFGSRTLPVNLRNEHGTPNPGQRLYADVTSQPDSQFETLVQTARKAILDENSHLTATFVSFPLRVNFDHRQVTIRSRTQFEADWPQIFPPALVAKIREAIPHEMFVHEGVAMLGDGDLWFDQRGIVAINVPAEPAVSIPKTLSSVLSEVKAKSHIAVLLPSTLSEPVADAKYPVIEKASEDEYAISLYYQPDIGNAGFAALFTAQANPNYEPQELPNIRKVELSKGILGYFRPVSCGGSCAPANLWWKEDRVLYQIQLKLSSTVPEKDQQSVLAAAANSAILAGPR